MLGSWVAISSVGEIGMSGVAYFFWLMSMIPGFFFYAWPVTLILLIFLGGAFSSWLHQEHCPRLKITHLASGLALTSLILLFGTLYSSKSNLYIHPHSGIGGAIVLWILLAQLALSVLFVVRASQGARLLSACILFAEFLVSLVAAYLASMSISSTWI